jgi:hypothetical protein
MTNPLPYIRNKFCFWLTGLSLDEIHSLKDKVEASEPENDYVSKSDFDPDDYDFSPLNDYDFSEFLTNDNIDEQIECFLSNNNYITSDYLEGEYVEFETYEDVINGLRNRLTELESKGKKKKKKKITKPTE